MAVLVRNSRDSDQTAAIPLQNPQISASHSQEPQSPAPVRQNAEPSLISGALTVIGQLLSEGDIQIDGRVEGDIRGHIIKIGSTAAIKGSVFGEAVEVAGTIEGKIEAKNVILTKVARMTGDIVHQSLQIEQGAHFDGNSRPHSGRSAPKNL